MPPIPEPHRPAPPVRADEGVDLVLPLSILIGALIVAGSVVYGAKTVGTNLGSGSPVAVQQPNAPTAPQAPAPGQRVQVALGANPTLGADDAPVTIVEFSDLQCPFCQRYHQQTWPQLKAEYIDTGKVKYAFRHFPLNNIHPDAAKSGEATACAREQGKFWEMKDLIFDNMQTQKVDDLKGFATQLSLNTRSFNECLDSGRMASEVERDLTEGSSLGVSGTPTFYVNGMQLVGAQPFEAFKAAIDQELGA